MMNYKFSAGLIVKVKNTLLKTDNFNNQNLFRFKQSKSGICFNTTPQTVPTLLL